MSTVIGRNLAESTFRSKSHSFKQQIHVNNEEKEHQNAQQQEVLYDEAENFVFDSVYVHFDLSVFVHQFILHMFLPFSIPLSPSPRAQSMWVDRDMSWGDMLGNIFLMVLNTTAFVSIISYEFMPMEDRVHYFGAVAYPILFSTMWRLSVAIKYGNRTQTFMHPLT